MKHSKILVTSVSVLLIVAVCLVSYRIVSWMLASGQAEDNTGDTIGALPVVDGAVVSINTPSVANESNVSVTKDDPVSSGDVAPAVHDDNDLIAKLTSHNYDEFRRRWKLLDDAARLSHIIKNSGTIISVWENIIQKDVDYVMYTVQEGDGFITIARKFQQRLDKVITYGSIKFFNGYTADTLKPYVQIRIPNGDFSILVLRDAFRLFILYNDIPVKGYRIGIGKDDATPAGEFQIEAKAAKPIWYSPKESEYKGEVIPYGDPRNILGTHWLSLKHPRYKSLGIHGTNDPASIGTKSSRGCIRLVNEEVRELYEILPSGTKVIIQ